MAVTGSCESMVNEALLLDRQGRIAEAMIAYQRVLERWPALPNCWYNLAVLQRRTRQFSAALISYQAALERGVTQPEEVHLNRGVIYSDFLRDEAAAERELNTALALNPTYIPALINLANLHEDLGRKDPAAAAYERILTLEPESAQALARYAGLRSFSDLNDPLIDRLRKVISRPGISLADRASVEFALGRALDGCQAYEAAFEVYEAANRDSRQSAGVGAAYDRKGAEAYVDRLIAAFPMAGAPAAPRAAPRPSPRPIFVCGMFRSGSTLVEQLLAGHPRVAAGGELDFLPYAVQTSLAPFPESIAAMPPERLELLRTAYLRMLGEVFPASEYVTDKRPENYLNIGLIKLLFPDAKIVHTTRDSLDNCLSIFFLHLDPRMNYALDLMDIGHHYREYLRLMRHWRSRFGADTFEVDYDALVRDPKPVMQELLKFLGLQWDERCLTVGQAQRSIKTASVWQVREALYQRSSGRARHYEQQLGQLKRYLEFGTA